MYRLCVRKLNIFDKLAKRTPVSEVDAIVDEIMTLSLVELVDLAKELKDSDFPEQRELDPLAKNRSPFPNPKHLFAGIDAKTH